MFLSPLLFSHLLVNDLDDEMMRMLLNLEGVPEPEKSFQNQLVAL